MINKTTKWDEYGIKARRTWEKRIKLRLNRDGYVVDLDVLDKTLTPDLLPLPRQLDKTRRGIRSGDKELAKFFDDLVRLSDDILLACVNNFINADIIINGENIDYGYDGHNNYEKLENKHILRILEDPFIPKSMCVEVLNNSEWVYSLGNEQEGKYKIGMTTRTPTQRINEFSPKLPFETEILAQCPTLDAYNLEGKLHEMFSDKRTNGEWFELSRGEMLYIRSMSI